MNYQQILAALHEEGFNWVSAAEAIGCSRTHVMGVAKRSTTSKSVATALCVLIEKPIDEVFSDVPQYQQPSREEQRQAKVASAKAKLKEASFRDCA